MYYIMMSYQIQKFSVILFIILNLQITCTFGVKTVPPSLRKLVGIAKEIDDSYNIYKSRIYIVQVQTTRHADMYGSTACQRIDIELEISKENQDLINNLFQKINEYKEEYDRLWDDGSLNENVRLINNVKRDTEYLKIKKQIQEELLKKYIEEKFSKPNCLNDIDRNIDELQDLIANKNNRLHFRGDGINHFSIDQDLIDNTDVHKKYISLNENQKHHHIRVELEEKINRIQQNAEGLLIKNKDQKSKTKEQKLQELTDYYSSLDHLMRSHIQLISKNYQQDGEEKIDNCKLVLDEIKKKIEKLKENGQGSPANPAEKPSWLKTKMGITVMSCCSLGIVILIVVIIVCVLYMNKNGKDQLITEDSSTKFQYDTV